MGALELRMFSKNLCKVTDFIKLAQIIISRSRIPVTSKPSNPNSEFMKWISNEMTFILREDITNVFFTCKCAFIFCQRSRDMPELVVRSQKDRALFVGLQRFRGLGRSGCSQFWACVRWAYTAFSPCTCHTGCMCQAQLGAVIAQPHPKPADGHHQMPGGLPGEGGMCEFQIDQYIIYMQIFICLAC